jgi:hypothetical protein
MAKGMGMVTAKARESLESQRLVKMTGLDAGAGKSRRQ